MNLIKNKSNTKDFYHFLVETANEWREYTENRIKNHYYVFTFHLFSLRHSLTHSHIQKLLQTRMKCFCDVERNESNEINARRFVKENYILNTESICCVCARARCARSPYTKEQRNQKINCTKSHYLVEWSSYCKCYKRKVQFMDV